MLSQQSFTALNISSAFAREFLLHHQCFPVERTRDGAILVAVTPEATHNALDDISVAYRGPVVLSTVSTQELER
jgi:hypothetical protein